MKSIRYDDYQGPRLPPRQQMERLRRVIDNELSPKQRDIMIAYYFQDKSVPQIAAERGVNKTSVWRCLRRAEAKVRACLRY